MWYRRIYHNIWYDIVHHFNMLDSWSLCFHLFAVATLSFNQSVYNINESDGQVQIVLVLSNPSSTNIDVKVKDSNVTAMSKWINIFVSVIIVIPLQGGDDYNSGPYNVTFIAGMTTTSFVISLIDDDAREDNESFTLTIDSSPVPVNDPNAVTVTIVDHDGKCSKYNRLLNVM